MCGKNKSEIAIKMTIGAILKEEHLLNKSVEHMIRDYSELISGERNSLEFKRWQVEMLNEDVRQKLEKAKANLLKSKLSFEQAKQTRHSREDANRQKASNVRYESEKFEKIKALRIENEHNRHLELVRKVKEFEKSVRSTGEQLVAEKRRIVKKIDDSEAKAQQSALEIV
jgi:ATP phosphoribosyltransferase